MREAIPVRPRQLDGLEQFVDAFPHRALLEIGAVHRERLGDGLGDREERIEARRRILEDEPDVLPDGREAALLHPVHLHTEHLEGSRGHGGEARDRPPDRGLARTRLPHEPDHLAGADREVDPVDGHEPWTAEPPGVLDAQVARDHDRRGVGRPAPAARRPRASARCVGRPRAAASCTGGPEPRRASGPPPPPRVPPGTSRRPGRRDRPPHPCCG